ncbi:MAG: hypothetical protein E5Y51_21525 [Mesorhizobium sp.]|uniref:hypothetical protein n=1 Tax=Mesorhizobium sp. M1A.F.Ca.IN.022.06.1.1 TaxID=2493680 RepID=UPI000F750038|nr:hypothetical protein [Mesorhizobium sp. M1A.F.Ca.IN.022.06.1.1]AZO61235.1 hypothetical protein EJ078_19735 [Mesorhizobium sp. M1A.F.Ca.IN.022.06.1.1]TIN14674.1 MAG: hypothetical protein E5Y51_21525 [Mesorhizobium sp.]
MFSTIKRLLGRKDTGRGPLAESLVRPMALLMALRQSTDEYAVAVQKGLSQFPAHRRKDSNVEAIWRDIISEVFLRMMEFGDADLAILADFKRQPEVLERFLNDRPHLSMPQPNGDQVDQTIQAVWQGYVYLAKIGEETLDRETSQFDLSKRGKDIISDLVQRAEALRATVSSPDASGLPVCFIEAVYEDVNLKAKSIALSAMFGPAYESGISHMLKLVTEGSSQAEVRMVEDSIQRIMNATTPDDIRKSR